MNGGIWVILNAALHADNLVLLILILDLGMAFSADGQGVALNIQVNVLLLKAGKICLQQVVIAFIRYIGTELRQFACVEETGKGIREKCSFKCLHLTEGIVGP